MGNPIEETFPILATNQMGDRNENTRTESVSEEISKEVFDEKIKEESNQRSYQR